MEDMGKLKWIKVVVKKSRVVVKFFNIKVKAIAMFRECRNFELKKYSATSLTYMWLLLKHIYEVKSRSFATSGVYSMEWVGQEDMDEAKAMEWFCLHKDFLQWVRAIVIVMTPSYGMLHMMDVEGATLCCLGVASFHPPQGDPTRRDCTRCREEMEVECSSWLIINVYIAILFWF